MDEDYKKQIDKDMENIQRIVEGWLPWWADMQNISKLQGQAKLSEEQVHLMLDILKPKKNWKLFELGIFIGLIIAIIMNILL
jgi:hypothetical protein